MQIKWKNKVWIKQLFSFILKCFIFSSKAVPKNQRNLKNCYPEANLISMDELNFLPWIRNHSSFQISGFHHLIYDLFVVILKSNYCARKYNCTFTQKLTRRKRPFYLSLGIDLQISVIIKFKIIIATLVTLYL